MPAFSYIAVDPQGHTRRGVIEADAPRQARAGLRSAGLVPVEVTAIGAETAAGSRRWTARRRSLSASELVLFTRRFAMLLEAGLTVGDCLDALIGQADREPARRALAAVRAEVRAGQSLGAALAQFPSTFSELYRALIAAGEQSGELARVMARLADYLEGRQAMAHGAGIALLYPAIVAAVALLVVAGLLTYVLPQIVEVYQQSRQGLPLLTRALLWTSAMLSHLYPLLLGAALLAALGARALYRREAVRLRWQQRMLGLPVLGPLALGEDTARLAGTLAILVGSGVPLLKALAACMGVLRYLPLRNAVQAALERVREGGSLHQALAGQGRFPPVFIHLVASGEASGRLAHMLAQAARQQEMENAMRLRIVAGVLEPALIGAMGIVVLLVVLAVLLPIIEMNHLVR